MENKIHQTAIIGPEVKIGKGNIIGPYCTIVGETEIGDNNIFDSYVSVGHPPESRDFFRHMGKTRIGSNNIFREFVTIHSGSTSITEIGNECLMLRASHAGHDVKLQNKVNVSCSVLIGGHTVIMEGANLGLNCIIHQRQIIGAYSMVGMGCVVTKKSTIFPGRTYGGNPARELKMNQIGLDRNNVTPEQIEKFVMDFYNLRNP